MGVYFVNYYCSSYFHTLLVTVQQHSLQLRQDRMHLIEHLKENHTLQPSQVVKSTASHPGIIDNQLFSGKRTP
jgi:hypothetical protein